MLSIQHHVLLLHRVLLLSRQKQRFHTASSIFTSRPFHDLHWLASLWKFVFYLFRGAVFYLSCKSTWNVKIKPVQIGIQNFTVTPKKKKNLPLHISPMFYFFMNVTEQLKRKLFFLFSPLEQNINISNWNKVQFNSIPYSVNTDLFSEFLHSFY